MKITILNMQLLNFKGVRNLNIEFGDVTNITGDNATGKTSIFDAFTWLLFGKNSEDAKDFNIKTLDANNQPIHRLEHEVTALLDVDGRHMKFRRVFREKWVKKRGQPEPDFTGHETEYYVDDVPLSQGEYNARVDFIMSEKIAKMITSPTYFNSLKWQDRRAVLEAMAGTISNTDIAANNYDFQNLLTAIGNESLIDFKKKIGAKKKLLKDSLDAIPTRIDEAERSKPFEIDYASLKKAADAVRAEIKSIETAIEDKSKAYELEYRKIQDKQREKHELEMKLQQAKQNSGAVKRNKISQLQSSISELEAEINTAQKSIARNLETIKGNQQRIDTLKQRNSKLRDEWTAENAKVLTIDDHALNCPTCKQSLPEDEQDNIRERLTKNFNESKQAALDRNVTEGKNNKAMMEKLEKESTELEQANSSLHTAADAATKKVAALREDVEAVKGWPEGDSKEVAELQKQIDAFVIPASPQINADELKSKKAELSSDLEAINRDLANEGQIERINARIEELKAEESKQAQELADLERMEFTMAAFSKAKIETIENRINGKFKIVKFKMFEQQINGGETEACECMVDGVPYSDVNTAGKIAAGIDIINALTTHYGINAPVFIDNRESIVRLPECESQIINLIVKEGAALTVEIPQEAMASN